MTKTCSKDIPHVSTSSIKPKYTTLKDIQDAIDDKTLSIVSNNTGLVHLALVTRTPQEFKTTNSGASFTTPVNPGSIAPTSPMYITTRASATAQAANPTAVVKTGDT